MKTRAIATALLTSIALLAGGCASATKSTPPSSSGCPKSITITATDASKTLCVAVGGTVTVDLTSTGGPWLPIEASGGALQQSDASPAPARGPQQASYSAKSTGTVEIMSSHPACPIEPGKISCHAIIAWKVTVQVK